MWKCYTFFFFLRVGYNVCEKCYKHFFFLTVGYNVCEKCYTLFYSDAKNRNPREVLNYYKTLFAKKMLSTIYFKVFSFNFLGAFGEKYKKYYVSWPISRSKKCYPTRYFQKIFWIPQSLKI